MSLEKFRANFSWERARLCESWLRILGCMRTHAERVCKNRGSLEISVDHPDAIQVLLADGPGFGFADVCIQELCLHVVVAGGTANTHKQSILPIV